MQICFIALPGSRQNVLGPSHEFAERGDNLGPIGCNHPFSGDNDYIDAAGRFVAI